MLPSPSSISTNPPLRSSPSSALSRRPQYLPRSTNADKFGIVAVDQAWLFASVFAGEIVPCHAFQPGGEDKDVEARDILALISCLVNSQNICGPDFPFIHLARKYPHRSIQQFRELYEKKKHTVDESVAKNCGKRVDMITRHPNSVESTPNRISAIPFVDSSFRGPSQWQPILPTPSFGSIPRGVDQESNQGGVPGVSYFSPIQREPSEQAGSIGTMAALPWFAGQTTPLGRLGSLSNPHETQDTEMLAHMEEAPIQDTNAGVLIAAHKDVESSTRETRRLKSGSNAPAPGTSTSPNTSKKNYVNKTDTVRSKEEFDPENIYPYERDAMRMWHGNHPLKRTSSLVKYWAEFRRENSVGRDREIEEWVMLDQYHEITRSTIVPAESRPKRHPPQRATKEKTAQSGRRNPPRTNKGGELVWLTLKDGRSALNGSPKATHQRSKRL